MTGRHRKGGEHTETDNLIDRDLPSKATNKYTKGGEDTETDEDTETGEDTDMGENTDSEGYTKDAENRTHKDTNSLK